MFEIQSKKSGRISIGSKNNSTSRSKLLKKELTAPKQKIIFDIVKTEGHLKEKKSKSQCLSKQLPAERRSIDVSKFIQTTRSAKTKKSREKTEKISKHEILHTQDKAKHESYLISNLNTQKSAELKWNKKNSLKKVTQGRSVERKKMSWNENNLPLSWLYTIQHYSHYLTKFQQTQIRQYKKIYYIGHKAAKREKIESNYTFDNEQKQYRFIQNDHIAYRYQLLSLIGKGSYGQVFKAFDHKNKEEIALKIIKNDPKFSKQAFIQIKILSFIKEQDDQQQSNIVRVKDFVLFRNHVCILFELLSDNLYELIIRNNYNGLGQELIRRFAIQMLVSLQFLRNKNIIHCDLKPENILLKEYNKSGIKIIDFGSSCFEKETIYTYIQSRYYRAPQITLGVSYNHSIDIWSVGCILAELYTGVPVFPGQNQLEQMKYMTDTLGHPSKALILRGSRRSVFFDEQGQIKSEIKGLTSTIDMFSKPLKERIENQDFLLFIQQFLRWDPQERIAPLAALNHQWISKGLPQQLKNKLNSGNQNIVKRQSMSKHESSTKMKTKSKEKDSTIKITSKASQEKLKRSYGLKF